MGEDSFFFHSYILGFAINVCVGVFFHFYPNIGLGDYSVVKMYVYGTYICCIYIYLQVIEGLLRACILSR